MTTKLVSIVLLMFFVGACSRNHDNFSLEDAKGRLALDASSADMMTALGKPDREQSIPKSEPEWRGSIWTYNCSDGRLFVVMYEGKLFGYAHLNEDKSDVKGFYKTGGNDRTSDDLFDMVKAGRAQNAIKRECGLPVK